MSVRVTQPEREEMLRLRMERGLNNAQIAEAIGRTHFAVTHSIGPSGSISAEAKWRECNLCHKDFLSEWPGNRKCGSCRRVTRGWDSSFEL